MDPAIDVATRTAVIELRDVVKVYRTDAGPFRALDGVSLRIDAGELVAVVGRSGSGKSTLLNIVTAIDRATSGEVVVAGTDVGRLAERRTPRWRGTTVGVIFQFFQLLPTLTILENVMLPMDFAGRGSARERRERALYLLEAVGLADQAGKLPLSSSGGQQQRAAIARALAMRPQLMLFDEPTSSLDPELVGDVLRVIRTLAEEGRTMMLVTHEMAFAREVASRVIFLHQGRVEEEGPPSQIFGHARSERARQFISSQLRS